MRIEIWLKATKIHTHTHVHVYSKYWRLFACVPHNVSGICTYVYYMQNRLLKYLAWASLSSKFLMYNPRNWHMALHPDANTFMHWTHTFVLIWNWYMVLWTKYICIYTYMRFSLGLGDNYRCRNEDYVSGEAGWTTYLGQEIAFVPPFELGSLCQPHYIAIVAYRAYIKIYAHAVPQTTTSNTYRYLRYKPV